MEVAFTLYKGFLIAEYSETDVKAYRNREYYAANTTSYETTSQAFISQMIDEAGDEGDFSDVEYHKVMRILGRQPTIGEAVKMNYIAYFEDGSNVSMYSTYQEVSDAYPDAIKIDEA